MNDENKTFSTKEEWAKDALVNKEEYERLYNQSVENNEDFCLTSSLIMEMYGLRKAKDIDFSTK